MFSSVRLQLHTGYTFLDRLHNFLHKLTQIVLSVHKLDKLVNSGKFLDNCWISCQDMAGMKKVCDDFIIINLQDMSLAVAVKNKQFWLWSTSQISRLQSNLLKKLQGVIKLRHSEAFIFFSHQQLHKTSQNLTEWS